MSDCPKCNGTVPDSAKFCPDCGAVLGADALAGCVRVEQLEERSSRMRAGDSPQSRRWWTTTLRLRTLVSMPRRRHHQLERRLQHQLLGPRMGDLGTRARPGTRHRRNRLLGDVRLAGPISVRLR